MNILMLLLAIALCLIIFMIGVISGIAISGIIIKKKGDDYENLSK